MAYYSSSNNQTTAARFLLTLSPGTPNVRFQADGGGFAGLWSGTFQGTDSSGNVLFSNLINVSTGVSIPGLSRVALSTINTVVV